MEVTHHRVVGDECIWFRKECDLWMFAESVSFYQVLDVVNDDIIIKKMFNGELLIFLKKDTEKVVLLHYKWHQVQGWKNLFVGHNILCKKTVL